MDSDALHVRSLGCVRLVGNSKSPTTAEQALFMFMCTVYAYMQLHSAKAPPSPYISVHPLTPRRTPVRPLQVQLPSDKEQMVRDVTSALDSLGCRYSIERGELCNVVTATRDFGDGEASEAGATGPLEVQHGDAPPPPDGTPYVAGQLTVRIRLHPNSNDASTSDLCVCWFDTPPLSERLLGVEA